MPSPNRTLALAIACLTLILSGCSDKPKEPPASGPKENDTIKSIELRATAKLGPVFVVTTEGVVGPREAKVLRCVQPKDGPPKVTVQLWDGKEYTASSTNPADRFPVGKTLVRIVVSRPKAEVGDTWQFISIDDKMMGLMVATNIAVTEE